MSETFSSGTKTLTQTKKPPERSLQNISLCTETDFEILSLMPLIIYHAKNMAVITFEQKSFYRMYMYKMYIFFN